MSDAQIKEAAPNGKRPRQGRSPGFPFIPLQKALERVDAVRIAEGGRPKHFAPIASACKAWGMGLKTGPAIQTVAALGHFGLCEFEGTADARALRPTDLAIRILLDKQPASAERDELIKRAALNPSIHNELWEKWRDALPSDHTLETFLILDRGFSETGARDLIAEYKSTIAFAKLSQSDIITPSNLADHDGDAPDSEKAKIGDLVQVEIGGAFQLAMPARVRAIQEHEGQKWVFVDGSEAGIPMEQVVLQSKGTASPMVTPVKVPPHLPEVATEAAIHKGEREWLRGPLSKETSYRLIVSGDLGPKELGKLIKLLTAQKAVLADEDDGEAE